MIALYILLALLFVFVLVLFLRPLNLQTLISTPRPAGSYQEALDRFEEDQKAGTDLMDVCRSKLMTHGHQTEHVIVFLHGYTTCPEQFMEMGKRFFDLGFNVFIPCMPYHGNPNRLFKGLGNLTAEVLARYGDHSVDIACGLGRQVTIFGFSAGGAVTAWLAQNRQDVDFAVPHSPFLQPNQMRSFLVQPFINVLSALPDIYIWWDPITKEKNPYSIYYAYPHYSMRGAAHLMRLAKALEEQAQANPPKAGKILVIINDFDLGVSNAAIAHLFSLWQKTRPEALTSYHFERSMKMLHDVVTPNSPGVPTEEVYQRIISQVLTLQSSSTP